MAKRRKKKSNALSNVGMRKSVIPADMIGKYADRFGFSERLSIEHKPTKTLEVVEKDISIKVIRSYRPNAKILSIVRTVYKESKDNSGKLYVPYMNINRRLYKSDKHGYYIVVSSKF